MFGGGTVDKECVVGVRSPIGTAVAFLGISRKVSSFFGASH